VQNDLTKKEYDHAFPNDKRSKARGHYTKRWGRKKELQLAKLVNENATLKKIAKIFDRDQATVFQKIYKIGFLYLDSFELEKYGVMPNGKDGNRIPDKDCPDSVKQMRQRYPSK